METLITIILIIAVIYWIIENILPVLAALAVVIAFVGFFVWLAWLVKLPSSSSQKAKNAKEAYEDVEKQKKLLQTAIDNCREIKQGDKQEENYQEFQDAIANAQYVHDKSSKLEEFKTAKFELDYAKSKFLSSFEFEKSLKDNVLPEARTKDEELKDLIDKLLAEMNVLNNLEPANDRIKQLINKLKKVYYPRLYRIVKKFNDIDYSVGTDEYQKVLNQSKIAISSIYEAIKKVEKENTEEQFSDISIDLKTLDSLLQKDGLSSKNQMKL